MIYKLANSLLLRLFLSEVLLCFSFTGCGILHRNNKIPQAPIPHSNVYIEEQVITLALMDLELPEGRDRKVSYRIEGNDDASDMIRLIAPEILLRRNYQIVEDESLFPVIIFSLDTLRVMLTSERSKKIHEKIKRHAEARITAVFREAEKTRYVFKGCGTYEDIFHPRMLDSLDLGNAYVTNRISDVRYSAKVKPVIIGVAITVLAWMLYSYRG